VPGFESKIWERVQRGNDESRRTLTHPAENFIWEKNHIFLNHRILLHFSIDPGNETCRCCLLGKNSWAHEDRPDRSKLVQVHGVEKPSTGLFGELEEAAREVITNCIAEDILGGFLRCDIAALARGDEDELTLVLLTMAGLGHRYG
jgi:hypothetical protein